MAKFVIILVLSNILFSTMTAAFRISHSTSTEYVTQKTTTSTIVSPVTASVSAALELKSVKSAASATNDKTESTTKSSPTSETFSNFKALKDTTPGVKKPHTTTESTTVSAGHDKTPQLSGKSSGSLVTSSLVTEALFSKIVHSTSNAAPIKLSPTFKPISLEEQNIPTSEQENLSGVIGRKMLSITKYENGLSSTNPSSSKTFTAQSTGFATKTTELTPSFKTLENNIHSTNGISVTNTPKTNGDMSGKLLSTSVNVPSSTTANVKVTYSPSNDLYKSTNGNKNSNVNNNSFGLLDHTQNLGFHNDPLATAPRSNDKDKNAGTTDIKNSNNLSTLIALTTASKLISSSTVSPKENYSGTTSKSTLPGMGFGSDQQTAVKNTISPNKLTDILVIKTDDTSTPTTSRTPIATTYTTIASSKSQLEVTTEGMRSAEINNRSADKQENMTNASSPHFSKILLLLGATAIPKIADGGSSAKNANIEVYSYKKISSSKMAALFPSVQSVQINNTNDTSNSSLLHKEIDEGESKFNSGQVQLWQQSFIGMLRTMFEHHKGNNNIILVPISIINNSGSVYLMDKNQGSQFSLGETVNNKSQVHSLADSENVVSSTVLTHLSTTVPTTSEKSIKLREPEEYDYYERPIAQKKKKHMDKKQDNVDSTESVSRRVPKRRRQSVNNKSQVHSLADSENVVSSTVLTHISTTVPTTSEKSIKLREPEENDYYEKPIAQKKNKHMDKKQDNDHVDSTESVSRRLPKSKQSPTKVQVMEMGQKENLMEENLKPVNSVGAVTVQNWHSLDVLHEKDEMYDSEDTTESHTQTNAVIVKKEVTKMKTPGMKISAKENGRLGTDQIHDNYSAEDTEYLTRTFDEPIRYKQNIQHRKYPSVMEEKVPIPYNRRIPQTKARRWDFEDVAISDL